MYRLMIILMVTLFLFGCTDKKEEKKQGKGVICIDGVQYYFGTAPKIAWMAPAYNKDGTLKLCNTETENYEK